MMQGGTLICGDFNSKSTLWGSASTDQRRDCVEESAAEQRLFLVNVGNTSTCVRPQGSSIIDLSWTTADMAGLVHDWRVMTDVDSLSDHEYISITQRGPGPHGDLRGRRCGPFVGVPASAGRRDGSAVALAGVAMGSGMGHHQGGG